MTTPAITKTIFLKAEPARVWSFLTEPKLLARWFHPSDRPLTSTGPYKFYKNLEEMEAGHCWGSVLEVQPNQRLVYTFTHEWLAGHETRVAWDLMPVSGGTMLTLAHDGFAGGPTDAFEAICDHDQGWDEHFATLRDRIPEPATA
jgi:uncharacterized protein YndB with AHSA1/START domain